MKIAEKKEIRFIKAREKFLNEIYMFGEGVNFAEKVCETETRRKQWIEVLQKKVNNLDLEQLKKMNGVEYGYTIANYIRDIEEVILKEFSSIISPFNRILTEYKVEVYSIFIL